MHLLLSGRRLVSPASAYHALCASYFSTLSQYINISISLPYLSCTSFGFHCIQCHANYFCSTRLMQLYQYPPSHTYLHTPINLKCQQCAIQCGGQRGVCAVRALRYYQYGFQSTDIFSSTYFSDSLKWSEHITYVHSD